MAHLPRRSRYVLRLAGPVGQSEHLVPGRIYALVITAAGGEQAAEASQKADKNQGAGS
jgi:hypothetical protein